MGKTRRNQKERTLAGQAENKGRRENFKNCCKTESKKGREPAEQAKTEQRLA
jgi:hypothetical protein